MSSWFYRWCLIDTEQSGFCFRSSRRSADGGGWRFFWGKCYSISILRILLPRLHRLPQLKHLPGVYQLIIRLREALDEKLLYSWRCWLISLLWETLPSLIQIKSAVLIWLRLVTHWTPQLADEDPGSRRRTRITLASHQTHKHDTDGI